MYDLVVKLISIFNKLKYNANITLRERKVCKRHRSCLTQSYPPVKSQYCFRCLRNNEDL